jgi:hypothetical protein
MSDTNLVRAVLNVLREAENVDIQQLAAGLDFRPVRKKPIPYEPTEATDLNQMPKLSYMVNSEPQTVITYTADGKETENRAEAGDIIMSGPSREKYVLKPNKFAKVYQGQIGGTVIPEQSPRMVATYDGDREVRFIAPWGESMVLKPGDYLVKDGDDGHYRIAKLEFEHTYNQS